MLGRFRSVPQSPETQKKLLKMMPSTRLPKRIDVISGLVEATLIFALCASFASTLFNDETRLKDYVALGMQSHLLTATIVGFCQSRFSELELSLAAPDIVPTLVMSNLLSQAYANGNTPTIGNSLAIISLCTVLTGVGCVIVGRSGLSSRATNTMPDVIFNGFVVVAGFLIFSKGIKMSMPKSIHHRGIFDEESGKQYLIFALAGLPHGVAMFIQKRYNLTPADVVIPVILFSPLVIFVVCSMFTWGSLNWVNAARLQGWMLDSGPASAFYEPTSAVYLGEVDWMFVLTSAPVVLLSSAAFLVGDIFFKTLGTIKLLDPKRSIDREMILQGGMNVLSGMLCGVPGYSQMKLAAINMGFVGKHATTRIPSMICSTTLCILFFLAPPLTDYVPRFWLSGILYNVAIGFIVEGFWDPALSMRQRGIILVMVLIYFTKSILGTLNHSLSLRHAIVEVPVEISQG